MWCENGRCRIKQLQVCWYDMERESKGCFDESFYEPKNAGEVLAWIETMEEKTWCYRTRVFVHMDNGDCCELQMRKLTEKQQKECSSFYGGR